MLSIRCLLGVTLTAVQVDAVLINDDSTDESLGLDGKESHTTKQETSLLLQRWGLEDGDEEKMKGIITALNGPESDAPWQWEDFVDSNVLRRTRIDNLEFGHDFTPWTFFRTKWLSNSGEHNGNPKVGIMLHLIHRHGLAPWRSAMFRDEFEDHVVEKLLEEGQIPENETDSFGFFVEAQESFPHVKSLIEQLLSLSLNALRNLHSYDHQWSVNTGSRYNPKCRRSGKTIEKVTVETPGVCALQASYSKKTHDLMVEFGGLTTGVAADFNAKHDKLLETIEAGVKNELPGANKNVSLRTSDFDAIKKMMSRYTTGDMNADGVTAGCDDEDADKCVLFGDFDWEDNEKQDKKVNMMIPITRSKLETLYTDGRWFDSQFDGQKVETFVEDWFAEQTKKHYAWVNKPENRMAQWAQEQGEFALLYEGPGGSRIKKVRWVKEGNESAPEAVEIGDQACSDHDKGCYYWHCGGNYASYMEKNCRLRCGLCPAVSTTTNTTL